MIIVSTKTMENTNGCYNNNNIKAIFENSNANSFNNYHKLLPLKNKYLTIRKSSVVFNFSNSCLEKVKKFCRYYIGN